MFKNERVLSVLFAFPDEATDGQIDGVVERMRDGLRINVPVSGATGVETLLTVKFFVESEAENG